ncbi:MAG: hypothetical protein JWN98_1082 [Abditibacteriota bacterium]|nr:hypothetical protein [Abditibacteriota bacterium]
MPIQYDSEGHIESVNARFSGEARLILHELNLKKNEYAATRQQIEEQLALAQPKTGRVPLARMLGALNRNAANSSANHWVHQLQERKAEVEQRIRSIDDHIAQVQKLITDGAKVVATSSEALKTPPPDDRRA